MKREMNVKVWNGQENHAIITSGVEVQKGLERTKRVKNRLKGFTKALAITAGVTMLIGTTASAKDVSDYQDVPEGSWYYKYVADVSNQGLMTGLNENTFGSGENLGRGQFATVLYRMVGKPDTAYETTFPDVPEGKFFTIPAIWANKAGVVTGYSDRRFGAGDNVTREQVATMLYRYAKANGADMSALADYSGFPDGGKVSSFASEGMKWAIGSKIISGNGDGTLDPQGNVSRAVCATMISRYVSANQGGGGNEPAPEEPETPDVPENPGNTPNLDNINEWAAEHGWSTETQFGNAYKVIDGITYTCYAYRENPASIDVGGDSSLSGKVEILESVDGVPVTSITYGGFYNNDKITEVIIPASITKMWPNAFDNDEGITSFTFKGGVPEGFKAINVHGNPFTVNYPSGAAGWDSFRFDGDVIENNATYVAY